MASPGPPVGREERRPERRLEEDPRIKVARRGLVLSWSFFTVFLATAMVSAAAFGNHPHLLGLPRWVTWACLVVPAAFVVVLIPIVERLIPDIPLTDGDEEAS